MKLDNNYFPLQVIREQEKYLKENNVIYPSDEKMLEMIYDFNYLSNNQSVDLFPNRLFSFLTNKYKDSFFINKTVRKEIEKLALTYNLDSEKENETIVDLSIIFFNNISKSYTLKKWSQNKQVYYFDNELTKDLISVNEFETCEGAYDCLPYKTLCFDVEDYYHFINITKIACDEKINLNEFLNSVSNYGFNDAEKPKDFYLFSCSCVSKTLYETWTSRNKEKDALIDSPILKYLMKDNKANYFISTGLPKIFAVNNTTHKFEGEEFKRLKNNFVDFQILSLLNYLVSHKPDIEIDPIQEKQYCKPRKQPKANIHEVKKWDVGVRYGNALREYKKYQSIKKQSSEYVKNGSTVRPHSRCGHWHKYWYGKKDGSEKRILKPVWLNPILVNSDFKLDEDNLGVSIIEGDVVIHET